MPEPISDEYMSVKGVPKYMTHEYSFDWTTIFASVSLAYNIPCVLVFLKIAYFFFKNQKTIRKSGLRVELFQAFVLMQLWGIFLIISEFLLFRIPFTGVFTSFCASENPQILLKFISFFYYSSLYSSLLLTAFFCGLRVAILYSVEERKTKMAVFIVPLIILTIGVLVGIPQLKYPGMCIQMFGNYPFGSIVVISVFSYFNVFFVELQDMGFVSFTCLSIIILNSLMLRKLRQRKPSNTQKSATQTASIERTLSGTMIILLVPLIVHFIMATMILFQAYGFAPTILSHMMLIRPLFLDLRVHAVTLYFHWTHPVFKNHKNLIKVSGSINNRF